MPECIVCKGYYTSGTVCSRCGSDNKPWLAWRQSEPAEQGGLWGLLHFTEPHLLLPFFLTAIALALGLMGIAGLWEGVNLAVRLLTVAATVGGCLVIIQSAYTGRHRLREVYLLAKVKTAQSKKGTRAYLGAQLKLILVWAIVLGLLFYLVQAFIRSDLLWKILAWLLLEPRGETPGLPLPDEILQRIGGALPLLFVAAYVGISLASVYTSSQMLVQQYVEHASKALPPPIFLQGELLIRVVQREAQQHLSRLQSPPRTQQPPGKNSTLHATERGLGQKATQKSGEWTWDQMERTDDGGIRLKAIVKEGSKTEESLNGEPTEHPVYTTYVVEADPWSRITKVVREEPEEEK